MIRSFADATTEKLFLGEELSRKETNKLGTLNPVKAFERLAILNEADENPSCAFPPFTTTDSKEPQNTPSTRTPGNPHGESPSNGKIRK